MTFSLSDHRAPRLHLRFEKIPIFIINVFAYLFPLDSFIIFQKNYRIKYCYFLIFFAFIKKKFGFPPFDVNDELWGGIFINDAVSFDLRW